MKKNEFADLITEWRLLTEKTEEEQRKEDEENLALMDDTGTSKEVEEDPSAELGDEDEVTEEIEQSGDGDDTSEDSDAPESVEELEEDIQEDVEDLESFEDDAAATMEELTGMFKTLDDVLEENPELKEKLEKAGANGQKVFKSLFGLFQKIIQFCDDNKEKKPELSAEISATTTANLEAMKKVNTLAQELLGEIKSEGDTKETVEALIATTEEIVSVFEKAYAIAKKSPTEKIDPKTLIESLNIMLTTRKILKEHF